MVWFRHSTLFRGFALLVAIAVPLALSALIVFKPPRNRVEVLAFIGLFGLFGLLGGPLIWEALSICSRRLQRWTRLPLTLAWAAIRPLEPGREGFVQLDELVVRHSHQGWMELPCVDPCTRALDLPHSLRAASVRANLAKAKPGYSLVGREFPTTERTGRARSRRGTGS